MSNIKPILISDWDKGIASSPYTGFQNMQNVEPSLVPGVLSLTYSAVNKTSGIFTLPQWCVQDNSNNNSPFYSLDSSGNVYTVNNLTGVFTTNWTQINASVSGKGGAGDGNGMAIWKNYLFITRQTKIDCYGPLSGVAGAGTISGSSTTITGSGTAFTTACAVGDTITFGTGSNLQIRYITAITDNTHLTVNSAFSPQPSGATYSFINWTTGFQTIKTDSAHPMLAGQDDILYGGGGVDTTNKLGASVFSLQQVAGKVFSPTDSTTYTYTANALQLPYPYRISCLAELGQDLMIGTVIGTANVANQQIQKVADIFPWDRHSASFRLPIRLFEFGVNSMLNLQNQLYIQAGNAGKFYLFNGYSADKLFTFPAGINNNINASTTVKPQAMMYFKNKLFFGITRANGESGIYSVNLDGTGLVMENTISNGATTNNVGIGFIAPITDNFYYFIGWQDNGANTGGIDTVSGSNDYNSSYTGVVYTQMYRFGSVLIPNTISQIDIFLDKPLAVNEGIKIDYRFNITDGWTSLITFDYATFGALSSYNFPTSSLTGDLMQFRISLTGTTTTPRLKDIILYPNP